MEIYNGSNVSWAFWKIPADESFLQERADEIAPSSITHPDKRLEFLAGRVLIKSLLNQWGMDYHGLIKDEFGKPFLKNQTFEVSLSHSYPYVAAVLSRSGAVGIDLEQPKQKLLRIAPRVLGPVELKDAGTDVIKHCVYWCAKEALVKIHGKKDLTFAENLSIEPFSRVFQGDLIGRIIVDEIETTIPLQYQVEDNFVVVLNKVHV